MLNQKIVIVDTGCSNIASVKFAIERLGYDVIISRDRQVVLAADKVFLPGVGTASEAMENLAERDLIELIKQIEKPVLGICLGMQLLGKLSTENGNSSEQTIECLGLCDGEVTKLQVQGLPLPHMGWNTVEFVSEHPLFAGIDQNSYFYFVHSFGMQIGDYSIAFCQYGQGFTAALQVGNYYGVQFHPERSSKTGSKLIENFLQL